MSSQIPILIRASLKHGYAGYVGTGKGAWGHGEPSIALGIENRATDRIRVSLSVNLVHVSDLTDGYLSEWSIRPSYRRRNKG